jgi:glycosyltransferase involved in cell wall biosynthesis
MKKKLLFVMDNMGGGGAERVLSFVLQEMIKTEFDAHLYLIVKEGIYLDKIPKQINVSYLFLGDEQFKNPLVKLLYKFYRGLLFRILFAFPFLLSIYCKIKSGEYHIAISFCEGYNTILLSQIKNRFVKVIQWLQVDIRNHQPTKFATHFHQSMLSLDVFVAVSNETMIGFEELYGNKVAQKHKHVVYNPADVDSIIELSQVPFEGFKKNTLISIGRLQNQKRFDRLIEAHAILINKGYDFQTIILGKGSLLKELQALTIQQGVADSFIFAGFQSNVYPWLKAADVFVMSSDYEGLPGVVCEAMTLNKPIVSTRITGTVELLENGKYGILTDTTPESLAQGIELILNDKMKQSQMAEQLKAANGNFIFKSNIDDVLKVINQYV